MNNTLDLLIIQIRETLQFQCARFFNPLHHPHLDHECSFHLAIPTAKTLVEGATWVESQLGGTNLSKNRFNSTISRYCITTPKCGALKLGFNLIHLM